MSFTILLRTAGLALAATVLSVSAAHAVAPLRLTGSEPARNSVIDWPKQVHLHFNEKLAASGYGVEMIKPDGDSIPMEAALPSEDDKSLTAEVKVPLQAGAYMVVWHAQPVQGAPIKGDYTFIVH